LDATFASNEAESRQRFVKYDTAIAEVEAQIGNRKSEIGNPKVGRCLIQQSRHRAV
jgi:hypothetical protein